MKDKFIVWIVGINYTCPFHVSIAVIFCLVFFCSAPIFPIGKHKDSLILKERYHFLASCCWQSGIKCKSHAEFKSDESEPDGTWENSYCSQAIPSYIL